MHDLQLDQDRDLHAGHPPAASEAELRLSLRQAIEARDIADAAAREAKEIADKAKQEKSLASEALERFRASQETAGQLVLQEHAMALTKALKAGLELPSTPAPAAADNAAMASALARYQAFEQAAGSLVKEYETAKAEAMKAAEIVHIKANAVMDCIAHRLVSELIAARDVLWRLEEKASGFFLMDEHRQAPKFTALKEQVRRSLNRQSADRERNPAFVEFPKWADHIDRVNQDAWGRWKAFGRALERDADAVFDPLESEPRH